MDGYPFRPQRLIAARAAVLPCLASGLLPEVQAAGKPPKPVTLRLMTYSAWIGGTQVTDGYLKALSAIADSDADIVGLQESQGRPATALALDLGLRALAALLSSADSLFRSSFPRRSATRGWAPASA